MTSQKKLYCEYIDSDGRRQFETVFFVEESFSSDERIKYRLNGVVAQGGNGTVFICYNALTNERLAVKFLRVLDPVRRKRFEFERRVLSDLQHSNILPIRDSGLVEMTHRYPIPFIVTELFSTTIGRKFDMEGKFHVDDVKKFGKQICDAFDYLHTNGIVHRDIKPGNFFIEGDRVVVGDLGLAKTSMEEGTDRYFSDMTPPGEQVGSTLWMSPELFQYTKNKTTIIDRRSDLFQIGKVLWYMHTGNIVGSPDKEDDQSGGVLFDIVTKATHQKPEKRFQHAHEIRDMLDEL